jgi:hypothetical protein
MTIQPAFLYAAPIGVLTEFRGPLETAIDGHNRQPRRDPLLGATLASLQAGFNEAVRRHNLPTAPLRRRVKGVRYANL